MSPEQTKSVARRIADEAWNKGLLEIVDELVDERHVVHGAPPGFDHGPAGVKRSIDVFRSAFPDVHATVDQQVAEEDKVATHWTARGTHMREFMGLPPTNKPVTLRGITINRFANGKIIESWSYMDQISLIQQLELVDEGRRERSSDRPTGERREPGMDRRVGPRGEYRQGDVSTDIGGHDRPPMRG